MFPRTGTGLLLHYNKRGKTMKKTYAVLLLAGITAMSFAGDLVTKSGITYKNYVLMGAAPQGIKVFYNNGNGDRQVILPVDQFPDELKETVNKFAKNIPAARKAALEQAKQEKAEKAALTKQTRAANARQKKSAALLQKELDENKKIQERLKKQTPVSKNNNNLFKTR